MLNDLNISILNYKYENLSTSYSFLDKINDQIYCENIIKSIIKYKDKFIEYIKKFINKVIKFVSYYKTNAIKEIRVMKNIIKTLSIDNISNESSEPEEPEYNLIKKVNNFKHKVTVNALTSNYFDELNDHISNLNIINKLRLYINASNNMYPKNSQHNKNYNIRQILLNYFREILNKENKHDVYYKKIIDFTKVLDNIFKNDKNIDNLTVFNKFYSKIYNSYPYKKSDHRRKYILSISSKNIDSYKENVIRSLNELERTILDVTHSFTLITNYGNRLIAILDEDITKYAIEQNVNADSTVTLFYTSLIEVLSSIKNITHIINSLINRKYLIISNIDEIESSVKSKDNKSDQLTLKF